MNLQLEKRTISLNELIYSGATEQSVEVDYILPDYYPDIFKIIKCIPSVSVTSLNASNGRLSFDACVNIKVLYVSAEDNSVKCIDQKYNYSKNIELGTTDSVSVNINPKIDYVNCKAISERRLSIRANVNAQINAVAVNEKEIPNSCEGNGIQLKKSSVDCLGNMINLNKKFSYSEEIALSDSKDDISGILDICTEVLNTDYKIIANKIIIKSKCRVDIKYCAGNEIKTHSEQLQISGIIDAQGITDDHKCKTLFKIHNSEYELMGTDMAVLLLTVNAEVFCKGYTEENIGIIGDAYSTVFDCELKHESIELEKHIGDFDDVCDVVTNIKLDDISSVEAVIITLSDTSEILKDSVINGTVNVLIIGKNSNGEIIFGEKSSVFEHKTDFDTKKLSGIVCVSKKSDTYTLFADGNIEVKTELCVSGSAFSPQPTQVITEIDIKDEKTKNDTCYGIKIYYAEAGESIWEIAKRYNSKADIIMKENEIENEILDKRCALLIPMVF